MVAVSNYWHFKIPSIFLATFFCEFSLCQRYERMIQVSNLPFYCRNTRHGSLLVQVYARGSIQWPNTKWTRIVFTSLYRGRLQCKSVPVLAHLLLNWWTLTHPHNTNNHVCLIQIKCLHIWRTLARWLLMMNKNRPEQIAGSSYSELAKNLPPDWTGDLRSQTL